MNGINDTLLEGVTLPDQKDRSEAVYFPSMDYILYLRQDSAYVAERIDEWLTLLLDPQSKEAIGVKLKGFHHVYLDFMKLIKDQKIDIQIPFRSFIAVAEALACQVGEDIVQDHQLAHRYDAYEVARKIVGGVRVSPAEMKFTEAA